MGIGTLNAYSHIAIQEMSVAHHPFAFENYHIFRLGLTKNTFNMSAIYPNSTTKLKIISETNNTLRGTLFGENTKNTSRYQAKGEIIEALRTVLLFIKMNTTIRHPETQFLVRVVLMWR